MRKDGQAMKRQTVSMQAAQWQVVEEERRRLGLTSVSAALRVIVTLHGKKTSVVRGARR